MIKIYTIILGVFILIFFCCQPTERNELEELKFFVGVWNQELDSTITIEFTHDGYYYDSRYNKQSDDFKLNTRKLDGSIKEENYGRLCYKIMSRKGDILIVSIYGENNGVEFRRKGYIFEEENNRLIEIVYKMGEGLEEHIQYAVRYAKSGESSIPYSRLQDSLVLILPNHFDKDIIYIAFDQDVKDSDVANIDEDRKVYISNEGIDRISLKEDMKVLLDGSVSSYLTDEKGATIPLYTMQANEWKGLLKNSRNMGMEKTIFPVLLDSMIIFSSCRFNPSRDFVNKTFKQEITGNVLDFRYSTIKDELGYLGIE